MTRNDCQHAQEQMAPALIGDLDSGVLSQLREHITQCSDCAREMHLLSQALRRLSRLEEVPVPRPFFIEQPSGSGFGSWLRRVTLGQRAALTASFLLLLGALVLAATDFRIRLEDGVATMGFGQLPTEEGLEQAVVRTVDERLADYQRATAALGEQLAGNLASSEGRFRVLLEAALAAQRQQIQQDWLAYATEVESGVEGYVLGTLSGLNRGYRADLAGIADRLDRWDLRSAWQDQRVDNLTFAVLELSSFSTATNDDSKGISR